jgi:hypothetical protein
MKTAANISIILNMALVGALLWTWTVQRREQRVSPPPAGTQAVSPALATAVSAPPILRQTEQLPFHWSQLESSDYRTYVKNLRKIGCPEVTLRAIVTADVDAAYRQRSRELEQQLEEIENSSLAVQLNSYRDQQELKVQMERLPGEESSEICDLLGLKAAPDSQVTAARHQRNPSNDPAVMPLVLQPVDIAALNLSEQQLQVVQELRQQFLDEIGGANQDPADPAYRERWQKAQPEVDDNLRGMLGITVFENFQLAAQNP